MTAAKLPVTAKEFAAARAEVGEEFLRAVETAAEHVRAFHEKQVPRDWIDLSQPGVVLGQKFTPIARVGVHVPGFTATYPSTVIMTVAPAKAAGVEEIYLVTPARKDGTVHPARRWPPFPSSGVTRAFKVGGPQAIAALAYGTRTIPKVDKIVGPGSIYPTLAKKMVFGDVGIEGLYGPSEVVILADESADPRLLAADLLAQAEHMEDSPVILVTPVKAVAEAVQQELEKQLRRLPRKRLAAEAIARYGGIALTKSSGRSHRGGERTRGRARADLHRGTVRPALADQERGRDLRRPILARAAGRLRHRPLALPAHRADRALPLRTGHDGFPQAFQHYLHLDRGGEGPRRYGANAGRAGGAGRARAGGRGAAEEA